MLEAEVHPAANYESLKLKLPRTWEPSSSPRPLSINKGKEAHHFVSHGN